MSRGGRRRRSKKTSKPEVLPEVPQIAQVLPADNELEPVPAAPRSRPREAGGRQRSVLESMRTLPTQVQTLPADGLLLEELISNMQTEYGTPSTPQEYRLVVKVPTRDEAPLVEAKPEAEEPDEEAAVRKPRTTRRRRRGRRRTGGATSAEGEAEVDAEGDAEEGEDAEEPDGEDLN